MSVISRAGAGAVAAALLCAAAGGATPDNMIDLGRVGLTVMGVGNSGFVNPGAVFPVSAVGPLDGTPILARGATNDMASAELLGYTVGRALSEQEPDYAIGEYCTDYGGRDAAEVDWKRTSESIAQSAAFRGGFVKFINSVQAGAERRILFTAGGAVDIDWYYMGAEKPVRRTYTIASRTSGRPYRLYATRADEPNEAAYVDLSGKFVDFFGASNLLSHIDYDRSGSKRLTYRYTVTTNKIYNTAEVHCEQGQFVLAYYDTESRGNLLATIVVEVVPPTVHTVDATVGSELRPDGGGYDVEGLVATIRAGDKTDEDDPYAPYVEKFVAPLGMERQSPCHGKVYAITPTDASTSLVDMPMPWKVDIYWRAPDPMGTLWTFENDWYNITWPKDSLKVVVSGDSSEPGACLTVPTNYSATVTGYREPATLLTGATEWGEVLADGEGRFLVKVEAAVDPLRAWYLPVETCLREGGRNTHLVRAPRTFDWPVGKELTLVSGEGAGDGAIAEVATRMSSFLPGYVHEPVSTGRNWNPRLYHRPSPADEFMRGLDGTLGDLDLPEYDSDDDGTNDTITATGLTDPYALLESTLYGVNASETPVEVWWRGMVLEEGMEAPITYPGLVERYRLYWNETPGLFPEIALSSQLGSAGTMRAYTGRSFVFTSSNGVARVFSPDLDGLEEIETPVDENGDDDDDDDDEPVVYHLGLRLLPPEVTDATRTLGLGRILTLANTNGADNAELVLDLEEAGSNRVRVVAAVLKHAGRKTERTDYKSFTLERGRWSSVTLSLPDYFLGDDLDFTLGGGGCAAVGVAFDDVALWCGAGSERPYDDDEYFFNFDFDMDDLETFGSTGLRVAVDARGVTMVVEGGQSLDIGTYGEVDGLLYAEDGIAPELYWQNDPKKAGYNPNEEHAFLRQTDIDETCYVAWALRNDLNLKSDPNATPPYVLAMYPRNGRGEMRMYRVVACNADYPEFSCDVTVGQKMDPPAPLGLLEGCCSANNAAYALAPDPDAMPVMTDRNFEMWARSNGPADVYYSYPMQPGFCCPSLGDNQLEDGEYVSWMGCAAESAREPEDFTMTEVEVSFVIPDEEYDEGNDLSAPPPSPDEVPPPSEIDLRLNKKLPWRWNSNWPADTVPTMKIGQTLVRATQTLPEMFNASSMAVLWPLTNTCPVKVIDPTQVRHGGDLPITSNFAEEYGFTLGNSGNCQLRKGKYYFTGLPPSVSDRFYVDANAVGTNRLCLVGTWVEKQSGGSYLLPNVLSTQERTAIKGICKASSVKVKTAWDAAVDKLARDYVLPSPIRVVHGKEMNNQDNRMEEIVYLPKAAEFVFTNYFNQVKTGDIAPGYVVTNMFVGHGDFSNNVSVLLGKAMSVDTATATVGVKKDKITKKDITDFTNTWQKVWQARIPELKNVNWPTRTSQFVKYGVAYSWRKSQLELKHDYANHDHYALVADGSSSGWVVLIENDDPDTSRVPEGTPVQLHVLRVLPELYTDGIAVITDPLNKLSEQLTLHYRTPFGPGVDQFEFDWRRRQPDATGKIGTPSTNWNVVVAEDARTGHVDHHLGGNGASAEDYVNNYYTLRYKPKSGSTAFNYLNGKKFKVYGKEYDYSGTDKLWSGWCAPQLAEGWLQRTLNTVTPFSQRVDDFYANESDIKYTMFEQIGGPYQGDVALNNDNLANVGLLELYRTMFNRVESILVSATNDELKEPTKANLCKQLMLAATRIAQFYVFLGADAYADAKNPLISQGRDEFWEQEVPAADYSFANQVPSLLEEELALLRGLTSATAFPNKREAPCFNRLRWNLTRGMTEGEVAYVNNYGIQTDKGALDVNCAASQYPQGHGDAWGHYLSALSTYYRLIRNPKFDWQTAMGEMLMDQTVVNVDYQDEEKFADAVAKLVQTGLDTMALTFRKAYKESGGKSEERGGKSEERGGKSGVLGGYSDADAEQAFGYGEWAARTGMNAIYGWMTGNALLPDAETAKTAYSNFVDRGVSKIDRSTAPQLEAVCTLMRNLDQRLNDFESGMNPLGLSEHAVPFDIDPDELRAKNTHFEQILARTEKALANCKTVLDYANVYGSQLARIQNAEADAATEKETREQEFNQQLIAVFGTPYPEDCGVNGMYAQGYDGPDIYNYNYMDLGEFDIKYPLDTVFTNSYEWYAYKFNTIQRHPASTIHHQNYYVNIDGIRIKPANFKGKRATEGSVQTAYRAYLTAYSSLKGSMSTYKDKQDAYLRIYNRKVVGLTKSIVAAFLQQIAKIAERHDQAKDTQKMIGAMLAQSFSTADLWMAGGSTGTITDEGQANRVKIFNRFYKEYLTKLRLDGVTESGLLAQMANHKDKVTKAQKELNDAKMARDNAVADFNYGIQALKDANIIQVFDNDEHKARRNMQHNNGHDWNAQEPEENFIGPVCWGVQGLTGAWRRSKTEAEKTYVKEAEAVGDDENAFFIAGLLRSFVTEKFDKWFDIFYAFGLNDQHVIVCTEKNVSADIWPEDATETIWSKIKKPDFDDHIHLARGEKVAFTDAYKVALLEETKKFFQFVVRLQNRGEGQEEKSLIVIYQSLYEANEKVKGKQEALIAAESDYAAFLKDQNLPPEDTEEGKSQVGLFFYRIKTYFTGSGNAAKAIQNWSSLIDTSFGIATTVMDTISDLQAAAQAVASQGVDVRNKTAVLAGCEAAYRAEVYKGEEILEARELWRRQFSNNAVQYRYLDMFDRIQRSTALTKYSTAFDTAQRYVWELAKVYDYETGLLSEDKQAGDRFLADIVGTRSLGREGVPVSSGTTDGGLYDVVARLKANWDVIKPRLGMNNADKPEKWFSLRWENYRLGRDDVGNDSWRKLFKKGATFSGPRGVEKPVYCENILANTDFVRYCQPLANVPANAGKAEPGYIIYFNTSIYNAQNFFGLPLLGGDNQFSAADYATKIDAVGVYFENYDRAVESVSNKVALAKEPNVYLVPVGDDVMRSPAGTEREELCWKVVDQVLPLPYTIGSSELDSVGWIASMVGFDGTSDSGAVIRRHSTLRAGYNFTSTRLVGRSAWNTKWMLVIPASSLNSSFENALETFRETVTDIKIGIRAYSRSGN